MGLGSAMLRRLVGGARDDVAISSPDLCVGAAVGLSSPRTPAHAAPGWCSWKPPQQSVHMLCMSLSLQGPFLLLLGLWAFSSCLSRPLATCQGGHPRGDRHLAQGKTGSMSGRQLESSSVWEYI